jgi:hypothetical protein
MVLQVLAIYGIINNASAIRIMQENRTVPARPPTSLDWFKQYFAYTAAEPGSSSDCYGQSDLSDNPVQF